MIYKLFSWMLRTPIESVQVMRLQPGDILAVTIPEKLSASGRASAAESFERIVPPGVKAIICDGGSHMTIVRPPRTNP